MTKNTSNPYERLAETLNKIPNSFPTNEDGIHIIILEWIFTEEEADLVSKMKLRKETVKELSSRLDIPIEGLAERLAHQILLNTENTQEKITTVDEAFLSLLSEKSDDLISYLPLEKERFRKKDPTTIIDSEVDLFKEFSGQPDLGVGPGDDELIKRAIRKYKGNRNETTKKRLAQFLKVKLLKLGKEFKRTIEAYQKDVLKPFEIGDDPNDIDEERSLENIFDQGKSMEEVGYEDFFIRKKNRRKKTIVYIEFNFNKE